MSIRLISFLLWLTILSGAAQSTLFTVQNNGPRSKRINFVFLSEGYTTAQLPAFAGHVNTAINYLFSREPWQRYRSYCNVFRIEIASTQSGTDNGSAGTAVTTYFNSGFNTPSVTQLLTIDSTGQNRAYALMNTHVPEYDVPIVIVNDTKYGGSGGSISITSTNSSSAQIAEHEIGHSFANLADEYDNDYPGYTPSEKPNNTAVTSRNLIKWRSWIAAATPIPTPEGGAFGSAVGLFEGSMYRTVGQYRPHDNSLMRNLNRPTGEVNSQQFVISIYGQVSPVESYTPATLTRTVTQSLQTLDFSVVPKIPSLAPPLTVEWRMDGQPVSGATTESFSLLSDVFGNGSHTVSARVKDPTAYVRDDPADLLGETITWTLNLSGQLPETLAKWRTAYGPDAANPTQDGYPNLIKYALGLNPTQSITSSQRAYGGTVGSPPAIYQTLTVPRHLLRTDVSYLVEVSSDLISWNSGVGQTVLITDTSTELKVRDATPMGTGRRYLRLKISAAPP